MLANLSQLPLFSPPEGETPPCATAAKPIITLPFQRSEEIDVDRARRILGISKNALRRMLDKKIIRAYRLADAGGAEGKHWRIEYQDLVAYCDRLRVEHGISPRSVGAAGLRGRRRDADLLPFPIEETDHIADVAERLGCAPVAVLHLIQSGRLVAYQVLIGQPGCPWRIHTPSVDKYLLSLHQMASRRPAKPTSQRD